MSNLTFTIPVDLDVFKALTARLETGGQTHNDVLREILGLDSPLEADLLPNPYSTVSDALQRAVYKGQFYSRGLVLPDGTEIRARYKGQEYRSSIQNGNWLTEDGVQHDSPSAAAGHITKTIVNGLRFWEARLPGESGWRRLDVIRDSVSR